MRKIIHMKALILDTMVCIFCRVYHHMLLCCVQHVGHTKALQVGDVAHCLTIPYDYSGIYLENMIFNPTKTNMRTRLRSSVSRLIFERLFPSNFSVQLKPYQRISRLLIESLMVNFGGGCS